MNQGLQAACAKRRTSRLRPKNQIRHFDRAKLDRLAWDVADPACPGLPWGAPWAENLALRCAGPAPSLDFQHSVQRYPRPVFDFFRHLDAVDYIAIYQVFHCPAKMLR
jgi:hypothetical protein